MRLTYTQESDFRQLRDFGQKFSATFEFIGAHWRGLGRALLYIVLPAALLQGILSGVVQMDLQQHLLRHADGNLASTSGALARMGALRSMGESPYYWVSVVMGSLLVTLLVLTVYSYMRHCLRPSPSSAPIAVADVWTEVRALFLSSFLSYFGLCIIIIAGFVFFFIPGMYLAVVLSLFYVVKVMEGTSFGATYSRCRQLARGKWWSTFWLMMVVFFMVALMFGVIGSVSSAVAGMLGLYRPGVVNAGSDVVGVVISALTGLLALLLYPPLLIALAFQYFNLVERHDGVGLHNLVHQLGQTPVAATNATYHPDEEGEY